MTIAHGLVRTNDGTMVHRRECRYAAIGVSWPWVWAEGKPLTYVHDRQIAFRYRACRVCKPFDEVAP